MSSVYSDSLQKIVNDLKPLLGGTEAVDEKRLEVTLAAILVHAQHPSLGNVPVLNGLYEVLHDPSNQTYGLRLATLALLHHYWSQVSPLGQGAKIVALDQAIFALMQEQMGTYFPVSRNPFVPKKSRRGSAE